MKKKVILISLILLVVISVIIFVILTFASNSDKFTIVLSTNGGVPYKWEYISNDDVELVEKKEKSHCKNCDGGVVDLYYTFRMKKTGTSKIIFEYRDIVDNSVSAENIYEINYNGKSKPKIKVKKVNMIQ